MTTMIRVATAADTDTLLDSLLEAANWNGEVRNSRDDIRSSKYVVGWPANGDFGVIAEDGEGNGLGSAWCRFFAEENAGYGFVREDIPELTIGVASGARGNQIGTRLLDALMNLARERGCNAVSLSVEDGNPARRLYKRSGFIKVGRNGNSDTLLLEFSAI
ncbi:GNAT family N-acetyltransferase [Arthrobacter sp. STN4]|uniref:GNAT family N-acetyltransferase n=1 Tax=Arthrobacter sp. STN4 TaxID=2923276 RepID=UPI00211A1B44|nr:GNAT family N-acetyltransferase [Arthrobacter sp. STN4]MCQ9166149.1 GNAT family N-acetyltransferase [Arthrobacter sp. STN4]